LKIRKKDFMTTERNWADERSEKDAPCHYNNEEAHAWVAGYNSAIEAFKKELVNDLANFISKP